MTYEELQVHLKAAEDELEHAKAHVYRCDGAIQLLQQLIATAKRELEPVL